MHTNHPHEAYIRRVDTFRLVDKRNYLRNCVVLTVLSERAVNRIHRSLYAVLPWEGPCSGLHGKHDAISEWRSDGPAYCPTAPMDYEKRGEQGEDLLHEPMRGDWDRESDPLPVSLKGCLGS
ncbi:hypothetical protein TNCV_949301 [Trichonephila clavipes]|nr:hypothetical protein TNCV_949301 [Trichonephila clavipes]